MNMFCATVEKRSEDGSEEEEEMTSLGCLLSPH